MICQECGARPAMVHLEEIGVEGRRHLWLCEICAQARRDGWHPGSGLPGERSDDDDFGDPDPPRRTDPGFPPFPEPDLVPEPLDDLRDERPLRCPVCGFELTDLGRTNRLGCAACYDAFRDRLRPLLVRIHHHSSHLGRVPRHSTAHRSVAAEIARQRIALEKAIVAEQYEEAARLRDRIARLEAREQDGPQDQDDPADGKERP